MRPRDDGVNSCLVHEVEKPATDPAKRFHNARDNLLAPARRVPSFLVIFASATRKPSLRGSTVFVSVGERIALVIMGLLTTGT